MSDILLVMGVLTANQVADFFLNKQDPEAGDVITHLKLQKLLYYAQGWHLALRETPLFDDRIEAWAHGPVCPSVWVRFKGYSWEALPSELGQTDFSKCDSAITGFLNEVWTAYGQFSAKRLEELTHTEAPWVEARGQISEYASCDSEIAPEAMHKYFASLRGR